MSFQISRFVEIPFPKFRLSDFHFTHQSTVPNFTVLDCLLNQLSFFCSWSVWEFKYLVDLMIFAESSAVSLMDLVGDVKMKWVWLLHIILSIFPSKSTSMLKCLTCHLNSQVDWEEKIEIIWCNNQTHFILSCPNISIREIAELWAKMIKPSSYLNIRVNLNEKD